MKKINLILFFIGLVQLSFSQSVTVRYTLGLTSQITTVSNGGTIGLNADAHAITTIDITANIPTGQKLIVSCAGVPLANGITADYTTTAAPKTFTFQGDITNKQIMIDKQAADGNGDLSKFADFKFIKAAADESGVVDAKKQTPTRTNTVKDDQLRLNMLPPIGAVLQRYQGYKQTPYGLIDPADKEKTVHIFFDQYGSSLLSTVPQGIANHSYIVHIIAPGYTDKPSDFSYSVKQTAGSFSGAFNVLNDNQIASINSKLQGGRLNDYDTWLDNTWQLATATDDLTFDIILIAPDDKDKPVRTVLDTYTIKMSPVYHGTFDVGLFNSRLRNPSYSLVTSPLDEEAMVVKEADGGNRGVVTAMYTAYTSIPLLFLKVFAEDSYDRVSPRQGLSGRNFLDDHTIWQRFYPTVGVSLSKNVFENLFFGVNWEIARGLSLFAGGHWGKVNTFDYAPTDYVQGETAVTQEQFDYHINTAWKVGWVYGVKLDVKVVSNLFN